MDKISRIQFEALAKLEAAKSNKSVDFKSVLENFVKEVNDLQKEADNSIEKFTSGKEVDIHKVMIATQEAQISFQLMLELRNRLQTAYEEVMRTQI
ncbi:MAG: flagellar hook-basal body complex protein FliE [bacterium]|jgi:flagellar hook-basal body complex protein FliE|nr:flagellar hook-basal body complex protein FliE [bacterium]